jgi:pimeloyl-ACP methyl ester carboxylesterase
MLRAMATLTVRPGVDLAYDRAGAGPTLLLVHGITESRRSWDPLLPRLTATYDVVTVDLRGHGESSKVAPYDAGVFAEDLAGLIGTLGLNRPYLVGHYLGGVVVSALAAAVETPGVINIDQPLALSGFKAALTPAAPVIRGTSEQFEGFIDALFASMDGRLPAAERARIRAHGRPDQEVVTGIWGGVIDGSVEDLDALVDSILGGITAPYLSLHGIDPGPDYAGWLSKRCPSATVEVWPDDGHYPHLVESERFLARLAAFVEAPRR